MVVEFADVDASAGVEDEEELATCADEIFANKRANIAVSTSPTATLPTNGLFFMDWVNKVRLSTFVRFDAEWFSE